MRKLLIAILLLFALGTAEAAVYINPGNCYNYTSNYTYGFFNSTTNMTENATAFISETFCANLTNATFTNYCRINRTLNPGENYSVSEGACIVDIKTTSNQTYGVYEWPFEVFIEADNNYIRVTYGTDTKSFPRTSESFSYTISDKVVCPKVDTANAESVNFTYEQCKSYLPLMQGADWFKLLGMYVTEVDSKDNKTEQLGDEIRLCNKQLSDMTVEWEDRGKDIERCTNSTVILTEQNRQCEKDNSECETSNWIFLIVMLISMTIATIFGVRHYHFNKTKAGSLLHRT